MCSPLLYTDRLEEGRYQPLSICYTESTSAQMDRQAGWWMCMQCEAGDLVMKVTCIRAGRGFGNGTVSGAVGKGNGWVMKEQLQDSAEIQSS